MATTEPEASTVPRATWSDVLAHFAAEHKLGEHVAVEGPNGSGKSVLMLELLKERGKRQTVRKRPVSIAVLEGKTRDRTVTALGWPRLTKVEEWPPAYGDEQCVVWPRGGSSPAAVRNQRHVFSNVLRESFDSGNQIIYIDEAAYFEAPPPNGLGLSGWLDRYWREARSNGISLFAGTQRPVRVSRAMWSESYWLFLFRPEDEDDLKRVAGLSGRKQLVLDVLPTLDTHEFLMIRRRPKREVVISQVDTIG
jgi:hypothetical protein